MTLKFVSFFSTKPTFTLYDTEKINGKKDNTPANNVIKGLNSRREK